MRKIIIATVVLIFIAALVLPGLPAFAQTLDIGADAIDRDAYLGDSWTTISLDNPANASGEIGSVEIWANTDMSGVRVGTFYLVSGTTYKCRDSVVIGNVASGTKQTFSGLSIAVEEGDFIGAFWTGGRIEKDSAGFAGFYEVSGEYIDPGDEASYSLRAGDAISLYGTGVPVVAPTVTTQAVSNIGTTTATGHGTITDTGGEDCTKRGVCWNTTGNPTVADSKSEETGTFGTGAFTRPMTGLSSGQHYYVKAYAYNSIGYGYGGQVEFDTLGPPTVTSQTATNVEETTATWNGNITSTGGVNCDYRGFVWGTTSKADPGDVAPADSGYDSLWVQSGSYGTGAYTHNVTELTPGTTWYYRACVHNTYGWDYSNVEQTVYTKPGDPSSLTATTISSSQIDLTWTKGSGAEKTMVRRKIGSYPTSVTDGNQAYFDTGASHNDTELEAGTSYFYRAWAWDTNSGYSDGYSQATATTLVGELHLALWIQWEHDTTFTDKAIDSGAADSGTTTTLVDAALTQADDYWNNIILDIITTTDGEAPQGESAIVTNFTAVDDTLHFVALTAAVEAGDTYELRNDATPTFRTTSSDASISTTFDNYGPISEAVATVIVTEDVPGPLDDVTPVMPPEMYGELNTEHLPGASLINQLLGVGGIPQALFWIPFVFGLAAIAVLLAYKFARSMVIIFCVGLCIVVFFALTGGGVVSFWAVIEYVIIGMALLVAEKHLAW